MSEEQLTISQIYAKGKEKLEELEKLNNDTILK